jgi:hypothetical protein
MDTKMNRDYTTGIRDDVIYFTGTEVEHTPAYGMKTLFVVGVQPASVITTLANERFCTHIYLGANQSFNPSNDYESLQPWDELATRLLEQGFLVTLDFDVRFVENVIEMTCNEHVNFIPQISVKIPYAKQLNYNAMVKIDDKDFKATNPGVWCHLLHTLMDRKVFTDWNQYGKDQPI